MPELSAETLTEGFEVSLFHNSALLFGSYYESTSDDAIRAAALLYRDHTKRRAEEQRRLMDDTNGEEDARREQDHAQLMDLMDITDSTANIHSPPLTLPRSSNTPSPSSPEPSVAVALYQSLHAKRVQVLRSVLAAARADLDHHHQPRAPHLVTSSASSRASPAAASSSFPRRRPHPRLSPSTTVTTRSRMPLHSSLSHSIPPLLRWSLLSMFPLISSVSRSDPSLRLSTLRILVGILQSSPPLALMGEEEGMMEEMMGVLKGGGQGTVGEGGGEVGGAVVGLALHRGRLREVLAAVEPMLRGDERVREEDVAPYLAALREYRQGLPLLSVLTEDTLITAWRHHPLPAPPPAAATPDAPPPSLTTPAATPPSAEPPVAAGNEQAVSSLTVPLLSHPDDEAAEGPVPSAPPTSSPAPSAPLPPPPPPPAPAPASPPVTPLPHYGALATDGHFHFLHSASGLSKLGSGHHGTLQGHVYASCADPFAGLCPSLPPSLSTLLTPQSLQVYGGWLAHVQGWLYFRSSLFILSHPDLLAVRIDPQSLQAVGLVWAEQEAYQRLVSESSRGVVRWFQLMTDGVSLFLLREQHRDRHAFYLDQFHPTSSLPSSSSPSFSSSPSSSSPSTSSPSALSFALQRSSLLPSALTQFPSAHRYSRSLASLLSPYQFYVGQKVEAKDSINKCQRSASPPPHPALISPCSPSHLHPPSLSSSVPVQGAPLS